MIECMVSVKEMGSKQKIHCDRYCDEPFVPHSATQWMRAIIFCKNELYNPGERFTVSYL